MGQLFMGKELWCDQLEQMGMIKESNGCVY
jgi:hypothetical protein